MKAPQRGRRMEIIGCDLNALLLQEMRPIAFASAHLNDWREAPKNS
jgi:hypothetical protein